MKKLTKLLLIHWYTYEHECIDFSMINFITGKTGAGKSTIIDSLQLVLLGDTKGNFFNKAANEKAKRTMQGYLYGETGDDQEAGFLYMRQGNSFSSYVACEFFDDVKNSSFTNIYVADCEPDMNYTDKWIILNAPLPEEHFIDPLNETPMNIASLRKFLSNNYGKGSFEVFDTNQAYRRQALSKWGALGEKYLTLLRKAVPFTPISDIEQFITQQICDINNEIDVEVMASDIREYKNLEVNASMVKKRIEKLEEIAEAYKHISTLLDACEAIDFAVKRSNFERLVRELDQLKKSIDTNSRHATALNEEIHTLIDERKQLDKDLEKANKDLYSSDVLQKRDRLDKDIRQRQADLMQRENARSQAFSRIRNIGRAWRNAMPNIEKAGIEITDPQRNMIYEMASILEENIMSFDFDTMSFLNALRFSISVMVGDIGNQKEKLKSETFQQDIKVQNIRNGIKPFPANVCRLKERIEKELLRIHGIAIPVYVLADLLEIKDDSWRNSVEAALRQTKFHLMVEERYFLDAWQIYQDAKTTDGVFDAVLIDLKSLAQETIHVKEHSIASMVSSTNDYAMRYIAYVAGDIICVENDSDVFSFPKAISRHCVLHENDTVARIDTKHYALPYIGQHSLKVLLEQETQRLETMKQQLDALERSYATLSSAAKLETCSSSELLQFKDVIERAREIPEIHKQIKALEKELASINMDYVQQLEQKIKMLKDEINSHDVMISKKDNQKATFLEKIRVATEETMPQKETQIEDAKSTIRQHFSQDWIQSMGEPAFQKQLKEASSLDKLQEQLQEQSTAANEKLVEERKALSLLRQAYNREYRMPFDTESLENTEYDKDLEHLSSIDLPNYLHQITQAKENAYHKFRDDFIAKLKSNIETVQRQISELNASLRDSRFGTDSYHFEVRPRAQYRNYYDMITDTMLMSGGYNLMTDQFNEKYAREIAELFDLLIVNETEVSSAKRAEYEEKIKKFTDYRTYLLFDLIVTDTSGSTQRLSKTMTKKSGGETQIPFYISLLASFSQACRIKSPTMNNTLRLIILDEAFSKMDKERVREAISLLRRFGLQAIFSTPDDSAAEMAQLSDRSIIVYKDGRSSFTRYFSAADAMYKEEE